MDRARRLPSTLCFFHFFLATNRTNAPDTIEAILGNGISRFARAVATVEVLFLFLLLRDTYLFQPHPYVARHEFVTHVTTKILVTAIQTRGETIFCYLGNETKSRGDQTCYVGEGT